MAKYYYKTPEKSEIGKNLVSFWRECQKVEKAAENYARNMGAVEFFYSPEGFTGGVEWLVFAVPENVNVERWKEGTPIDGVRVWKPNVTTILKPSGDGKMSITYDSPYKEAKRQLVNGKRTNRRYSNRPNRHSNSFLSAVRAEKERMKLPVVSIDSLCALLQLKKIINPDAQKVLVQSYVPTFFLYKGDYYIACDDPSESKDMELINFEKYRFNLNMAVNDSHRKDEKMKD